MIRIARALPLIALLTASAAPASLPARPAYDSRAGEMLIELQVAGEVRAVADEYSAFCTLSGSGPSAVLAEQALAKARADFVKAAPSFGLNGEAISFPQPPERTIASVYERAEVAEEGSVNTKAVQYQQPASIIFPKTMAYAALVEKVSAAGCNISGEDTPFVHVKDWNALAQQAKSAAFANARAEAERQAAAHGLSVSRIIRIRPGASVEAFVPGFSMGILATLFGFGRYGLAETMLEDSRNGVVRSSMRIDFILAPKR